MWNVGQGKLADLPEIRCGIGIWSAGAESGEGGWASPGVSWPGHNAGGDRSEEEAGKQAFNDKSR